MKIKITNREVASMADAIQALDGGAVTEVVEGRLVQVFKSFRLAHAARWALARAQGTLQSALADFNRAKAALIREHSGGQPAIAAAHPQFAAFAQDLDQLLHQPVELELDAIELADLKPEANEQAGHELPISVLHALMPILQH